MSNENWRYYKIADRKKWNTCSRVGFSFLAPDLDQAFKMARDKIFGHSDLICVGQVSQEDWNKKL